MSSPFEADWRATLALQSALRSGWRPEPLARSDFSADEPTFAALEASVHVWAGVPLAIASSDPTTHAAAQQWQHLGTGEAVLTARRIAFRSAQPLDFGWIGLTGVQTDHEGLRLTYATSRYLMRVHAPHWLTTMLYVVAFGQVLDQQPPDWVARRLR